MIFLSNFLRYVLTFLSFPHNLIDEKLNKTQKKLIKELQIIAINKKKT